MARTRLKTTMATLVVAVLVVSASGVAATAASASVASASVSKVVPATKLASASAYPSPTVSIEGHGWGPGDGMGQWGAFGYAVSGTPYRSILDHFYGGTSVAGLSSSRASTQVRVALTENDGNTVIVTSDSAFTVSGAAPSLDVSPGHAVLMNPVGAGRWNVYVGDGCAGPWPSSPTRSGVADPTAIPDSSPGLGDPNAATQALQLCQGGGNLTVRGTVEATYNSNSAPRTVNTLPLEQYLSGVVPNESPAGWGTLGSAGPQGQKWGFQELEAQAVAARSYVMAGLGSWGGYADICDLTCQTYRGIRNENALTDLAVTDTAGQVLEYPSGSVAATQYSSSTGGYTAGGAFPAVVDTGDAVCIPGACNPNHTWTDSVPVSTIESAWPTLGTLESIDVTGRNGYGQWGGRVTSMTLVGSRQNVTISGNDFADALGLKSNWFTLNASLGGPAVGMASTRNGGGYWMTSRNGAVTNFGNAPFLGSAASLALVQPVVGLAATADGQGYWLVAADGGIFSYGNAHFFGSTGGLRLNKPVVGMAATPDGKGYWLVAADGGIFSYGSAKFYGSTGTMILNKPVVGMAATPDGKGYWLVAADGGIFSFGDARFYGSTGAIVLNKPVVGMAAAPGGTGYWLVASDGGIFSFGDAKFFGSTGGIVLNKPVVGMAALPDGQGYWLVASDGGLFALGAAPFLGSSAG
jgi:SpoIID/LytB domain protein